MDINGIQIQIDSADKGGHFLIFSLCFDSKFVSGKQEMGQIEFIRGDETFTCEYDNILPKFCGDGLDNHEMRELK
eukprot:CAMPEP_0201578730 /NCGR_PEP_ID=MMETSP0190_2-20130828/25775_1 /ASSEMBLY_ACC=CAM_ASM_000263 /TAXON_ID=37353 /ORGANISM="Rosalina sp." /LENGTH=74 /DNA_ID=CAMNT_0048012255 /DNA_START=312 /DNA_END=533 /DNA_ORIENTATION=+